MYNQYFGLQRAPFKITPDTRMFFRGAGRGEILDALVYAVTSGEGIIKVVGEVGTGKTMICRMLEDCMPPNVELVYLANPSLSPEDILHAVALEMRIPLDPAVNRLQVLHALQARLLEKHANNEHVVVLVEEAQSMATVTMEEIRLLSNLETRQDKLLQIVLFGQPELDDKLTDPGIRQLRERITHSFYLEPFEAEDTREYVKFRLQQSGYRGRDAFRGAAYASIAQASKGLTRRINILADKALLAAFAEDTHDVGRRHVRIAIDDSQFNLLRRWGWPEVALGTGALMVAATVAWAAAGGAIGLETLGGDDVEAPGIEAAAAATAALPVADGASPPPAEPTDLATMTPDSVDLGVERPPKRSSLLRSPSIPVRRSKRWRRGSERPNRRGPWRSRCLRTTPASRSARTPGQPRAPLPSALPVSIARACRRPGSRRRSAWHSPIPCVGTRGAPDSGPSPHLDQNPNSDSDPTEPIELTASADAGVAVETHPPTVEPVEVMLPVASAVEPSSQDVAGGGSLETPDSDVLPPTNSLVSRRLEATQNWLEGASRSHYSIQLILTTVARHKNLEDFLGTPELAGDIDNVYVYETTINSRRWFGVLYREYPTYSAARQALEQLPPRLHQHGPFIRKVSDIQGQG